MEENIPTFNNKVVSILVAIIVTACVLVPICNSFSQSTNEDDGSDVLSSQSDELDSTVYWLKSFWNYPTDVFTQYNVTDYEIGDIVAMDYAGETMIEVVSGSAGKVFRFHLMNQDDAIGYSDDYKKELARGHTYTVAESPTEWAADVNYVYDATSFEFKVSFHDRFGIQFKFASDDKLIANWNGYFVEDSKDNAEFGLTFSKNIVFTNLDQFVDTEWGEERSGVGVYVFNEKGYGIYSSYDTEGEYWTISGYSNSPVGFDYDAYGELSDTQWVDLYNSFVVNGFHISAWDNAKWVLYDEEGDTSPYTYRGYAMSFPTQAEYVVEEAPTPTPSPTPSGDSGMVGVLIALIPVFVAIALLGAIVTMFLNKREI